MPNVGKTSIYNIITNSDFNIIHKTIGTTRDWHVSNLKNNKNINIYDTPGIIINNKKTILKKVENIINKTDVILYVIDYKNENHSNDKELLNKLRKYNKRIVLIINKDDNFNQDKEHNYFGISNIFYLSCSHKLGINELNEYLSSFKVKTKDDKSINYTIGVYGKTNVGKSTLLNQFVGYDRSLVSNKPKTTTDIVSSLYKYKDNCYLIKDTAGLIKKNKIDKNSLDYHATKKTLSIIKDIDFNLFLIDVLQGFDSQSKKIFNLIYQKSNILLLIINKIDLINKDKKKILLDLKKDIENEFSQSKKIYILTISALNKKNINSLKNYIHKLTSQVDKSFATSKINQWLKKTITKNPHSRIKGKEVKFKYATQISNNPLTIKIFSNYSKEISIQYKRFLLNSFCDFFKLKSKKIKFIFSKSNNPYN